jgi:protein-S-isoprenylcysteine O-methyltransferase Ste14
MLQRPAPIYMTRGRAAITLFPPAVLMAAATLVGWGLDGLPAFFANPARAAVLAVIFCDFVAGTLLRIELNPFRKGTSSGRKWPILTGMLFVPLIWAVVTFCDRHGLFVLPVSKTIRWIGVAAFAFGSAIRLAALHELGRQYSAFLTIQANHQLIRSGIYARIRHPFYLGGLLNVPGAMLAFRSPIAILVFLASVIFVLTRIKREEQLLRAEFPDAYRDYQRTSWRLLPPVY